ncbi:tape measure protein [Achromobacter insolitus]|uniref:tape measure protein n=1 Tax=Achromobacter insolitus TaxID=217204 RepID=UPI003F506CC3|nr:tape measure domain-containing protein [Achromobacter insolitus]
MRELVTLLRYQVDESGLKKYQVAYQNAQSAMAATSAKTVKAMREAAVGAGIHPSAWAPRPVPVPATPAPVPVSAPRPVQVPAPSPATAPVPPVAPRPAPALSTPALSTPAPVPSAPPAIPPAVPRPVPVSAPTPQPAPAPAPAQVVRPTPAVPVLQAQPQPVIAPRPAPVQGVPPAPVVRPPAVPAVPRMPAPAAPAIPRVGRPVSFPVDVGGARGKFAQIQGAYNGLVARVRGGMRVVREAGAGAVEGFRLGLQDARQAQERLTRSQWNGVRAIKEQASAFSGLRGIIAGYLGFSLVKKISNDIDAWGQMEARMRQATASAREYAEVDKDLARVSRLTYKSYQSSAELFVRTRRTMADLGKSTQDTVDVTEGLSLGMALSSTKAQDQESVISSLTKAIMQGKLGMDEYSTLMRAAPRLQTALADGLGITTAALLEQVKAGKITTDKFLPALQSQLARMRIEAENMPVTVADAMTVWNDAFERFFGKTLTAGRTAVLGVTKSVEFLADNISTVIKLLALAGGAWGLVALRNWLRLATFQSGGLIRSLVAATRAAIGLDTAMALRRGPAGAARMLALWNRSLAPLLRMAAVLTTIYLIGDDILGWMRGDISVLGGLIGRVEDWQAQIDAVKATLVTVKNLLGGAGQELGPWIKKWGTIAVLVYGLWRILTPVRGLILFLARTAVPLLWRAFAMTPVGRVVTLVTAGLWLIWSQWDTITGLFSRSWDRITAAAKGTFMEPVLEYIQAIWAFWSGLVAGVIAAFTGDWDEAVKRWRDAFDGLWSFFAGIGDRMIRKIEEIGQAIQKWVMDKLAAAKRGVEGLLPDSLRDENMKETMGGFNAWLREKAPILEPLMGNAYPKADPAAVQRAGSAAARGPLTIRNEIASVSVTAPGADPASVSGATARGVNEGIRRGVEDIDRYFITGVEAAR